MNKVAIVLNIFLPPIGSFVAGKWVQGLLQLVLLAIAWFLIAAAVGAIVGIPIAIVAWVWAIVCAARSEPRKG